MLDLFSEETPWQEPLAEGAVILRRRARDDADALLAAIQEIAGQNPFAHRITPGGHRMSVAMTNPDACLINRYEQGAKLTLHQDKDEKDLRQPIVSVSLGLPAVFQFGGFERGDAAQRVLLEHGDIVVWGGPSRLRYHGILPLKPGIHPAVGAFRFNLTFRRAH